MTEGLGLKQQNQAASSQPPVEISLYLPTFMLLGVAKQPAV